MLVRRSIREAGAYRAGDVDQPVARVPLDAECVLRAMRLRMAASLALLVSLTLLALTKLAALRW